MPLKIKIMIIIKNKTEDPFARIPLLLLSDKKLKWKEKGLLCYLLSKPKGWKFRINDVVNRGSDGKDSIYSSLKSLIKAGYCLRMETRDSDGKITGTEYSIADNPHFLDIEKTLLSSYEEEPLTENPNTENQNISKNDSSKIEDVNNELFTMESIAKPERKNNFPWPQVMAIFTKHRPNKKYRTNPRGVTDRNIKSFWRRNNKDVAVFDELLTKLNESDYLMGSGDFEGIFPAPDPNWSWVFSKTTSGEWRCDKILNGDYSNERMEFTLTQNKSIEAIVIGKGTLTINPIEKLPDGSNRYEKLGTDEYTSLDKYLDKK